MFEIQGGGGGGSEPLWVATGVWVCLKIGGGGGMKYFGPDWGFVMAKDTWALKH